MPDSLQKKPDPKTVALWLLLLFLSLLAGTALSWAEVPAAFFVGAVVCGVSFGLQDSRLVLPRPFFLCAQALIGCSVARSMTPDTWAALANNWMVLLGIVCSSVLAGGLVGWSLMRFRILPGTTAAWGSSPGGAAAMVAMAESFGADARLVALMQYLRVLIVVLTASLVAHFLTAPKASSLPSAASLVTILFQGSFSQVILTLAVAAVCGVLAHRLRIPAGPLLVSMIVGAFLNSSGLVDFRLPYAFQICASVLLGWFVGLGFNRALLISAMRKIHWLFLSAFLLIALCAFFAWTLYRFAGCDPLTAYLATTPGGLDSVVLLAMGSQTDVPFVVAAQTLRLFVVILTGPIVARFICRLA